MAYTTIANFSAFLNGIYERLRKIKFIVKDVQKKFDMFIVAYQKVDESISDYEANVMNEYGHSAYSPIFTDMVKFSGANPYNHVYNWIKMELLDMKAMQECLAGFEDLQNQRDRQQKSLVTLSSDLEKLNSGKKSFKSFFSTKSKDKQKLNVAEQIAATQKAIVSYNKLINLVCGRLYEYEIPTFKDLKVKRYEQAMMHFAKIGAKDITEVLKSFNSISKNCS